MLDSSVKNDLNLLHAEAAGWAEAEAHERLALARALLADLNKDEWASAEDWAMQEAKVLGIDLSDPVAHSTASIQKYILALSVRDFLHSVINAEEMKMKGSKYQKPLILCTPPRTAQDGETQIQIYGPQDLGKLNPGMSFEVHCKASSSGNPENSTDTAAEKNGAGTVTLVLGAGNQPFLSMVDVLHAVFIRRQAVLLKHHPLRGHLQAPYAALARALVQRGVFRQVADRGVAAASALVAHPLVGHVHLTGSLATCRAVERAARAARPAKRGGACAVTSELGGASPWLVLPAPGGGGGWSAAEIQNAAKHVAVAKKANGGSNCLNAQVVVLPAGWAQREEFVEALCAQLAAQPTAPMYYPGARAARGRALAHYRALGEGRVRVCPGPPLQRRGTGTVAAAEDEAAVVFCGEVGAPGFDGMAAANELFCNVLAVVEVPAPQGLATEEAVRAYLLRTAVPWVNEAVFGSLCCSLLAGAAVPNAAIEEVVLALRYGTVSVNAWSVFGYNAMARGAVWGAHEADAAGAGESGRGLLGNVYGLPNPVKTVVRGPPLTKGPMIDGKPPPSVVIDALHVASGASGVLAGTYAVTKLLVVRFLAYVFSVLLFLVGCGGGAKVHAMNNSGSNSQADGVS